LSREKRASIRYIEGHFRFGLHEYIPGPATYITFLRDPLERLKSAYYYILSRPNHREYDAVRRMSLEQYMQDPISVDSVGTQVAVLSGLNAHKISQLENPNEALTLALQNTEKHFALVGLTERFDQSLILLAEAAGWHDMPFYTRKNTTRNKPVKTAISEEFISRVREIHSLDFQLYNEIKNRFEKTCLTIDGFDERVEQFKRRNAAYQQKHQWSSFFIPFAMTGVSLKQLVRHAIRLKRKVFR